MNSGYPFSSLFPGTDDGFARAIQVSTPVQVMNVRVKHLALVRPSVVYVTCTALYPRAMRTDKQNGGSDPCCYLTSGTTASGRNVLAVVASSFDTEVGPCRIRPSRGTHNHTFALSQIIQNVLHNTTLKTVLSRASAGRGGASIYSA